jgi:hypothetical protein
MMKPSKVYRIGDRDDLHGGSCEPWIAIDLTEHFASPTPFPITKPSPPRIETALREASITNINVVKSTWVHRVEAWQ